MKLKPNNPKAILFASFVLLLVLLVNSAFLSYKYWQFYFGGGMFNAFNCTDGCDTVMMSKYAMIFGFPTPLYGFLVFLIIFIIYSMIFVLKIKNQLLKTILDISVAGSCLAAFGFLYIMYQVLHMACKFCLLSHICTFLFALIYFYYMRKKL